MNINLTVVTQDSLEFILDFAAKADGDLANEAQKTLEKLAWEMQDFIFKVAQSDSWASSDACQVLAYCQAVMNNLATEENNS